MQFTELKKSLEQGEVFPVYILEGEDAYFRALALETLKNALVKEPTLNAATFDGASLDVGEALSSLTAAPFFSDYRMTVIKEFYPKAEALRGGLKEFLENPVKGSVLVIVNEKPHEAFKKFKTVCTVSCGAAEIPLIMRWIKATASAAQVKVSDAVCRTIAEYCLSDMTRVKNETEKLVAYAGVNGEITEQAVDFLVYRDSEYKIYEMTDYIAKKKFDSAIMIIEDMLSKGDTEAKIIAAVYNYFRRLLFVAISDKTNADTAALLGIKEFAVKKAKEQAAAFKVRALKNAVDRLADADYAVKSGKMNADDAMWINIFKIMTE
ncbi:MAG: DNA polymerase III subunit delta, partial [Clostridia bacterium]|nr:DNA polymerase III subunit delta [Clostridia bacterium]